MKQKQNLRYREQTDGRQGVGAGVGFSVRTFSPPAPTPESSFRKQNNGDSPSTILPEAEQTLLYKVLYKSWFWPNL